MKSYVRIDELLKLVLKRYDGSLWTDSSMLEQG
jgi:hypothetical protein